MRADFPAKLISSSSMTFILTDDGRDDDVSGAFARYRDYLQASKDRFPPAAYALATSNWYFDFTDHRSPHDGWVERFNLIEQRSIEEPKRRTISLSARLLGAYNDGHIELRYPKVLSYTLSLDSADRGHQDWRYDELRVSDGGTLIHEIEWWGGGRTGRWLIEAADVEFRWLPNDGPVSR